MQKKNRFSKKSTNRYCYICLGFIIQFIAKDLQGSFGEMTKRRWDFNQIKGGFGEMAKRKLGI